MQNCKSKFEMQLGIKQELGLELKLIEAICPFL